MKRFWRFYLTLLLIIFLASPVLAYQEGMVTKGGSISGKITLSGKAPDAQKVKIDKDQNVCGTEKTSDALVVSKDGTVKDVVVTIEGVEKGMKWNLTDESTLDQKGCWFKPHITLIKPGATLTVLNPDGITHNIHTYSVKNPSINKAQPKFKKKLEVKSKLKNPETIKLRCDIHKWMSGWIIVAESPYVDVTDDNGSFKIENIPPGKYTLKVWQETLGSKTQEVTIQAGANTNASVSFQMK